jgi:hypothetical protein
MMFLFPLPKFVDATEFADGFAVVDMGTAWGGIDESGEFSFEPKDKRAGPFGMQSLLLQIAHPFLKT